MGKFLSAASQNVVSASWYIGPIVNDSRYHRGDNEVTNTVVTTVDQHDDGVEKQNMYVPWNPSIQVAENRSSRTGDSEVAEMM